MVSRRRCPLCGALTTERLCAADGTPTLVSRAARPDLKTLVKGTVVSGRYRIDRVIGAGAFGTVFSATHLLTGQDLALKVLGNRGVDEDERGLLRFFHEARVTAKLAHPNTVRVFDFGQDDSGLVYLAMEFLRGKTLRQELSERMSNGKVFSEPEVIDIAVAITRSLSEAHAHGLVHRDLKPENVMLQRVLGDEPQVKVLDFGIVKQNTAALTAAGQTPCTPAYASPEQVIAAELDGRSDLYGLGIIMFELLTGEVPFLGPSVMQTLQMQVSMPAPDVRDRAKTSVSPELARVIGRALSKTKDARFFDAAEMRGALEASREGRGDRTSISEVGEQIEDTRIQPRNLDSETMETAPGVIDPAESTEERPPSRPLPLRRPSSALAPAPRPMPAWALLLTGSAIGLIVALGVVGARKTNDGDLITSAPLVTPPPRPTPSASPTPVAVSATPQVVVEAVPSPSITPEPTPSASAEPPKRPRRPVSTAPAPKPSPKSALDVEL